MTNQLYKILKDNKFLFFTATAIYGVVYLYREGKEIQNLKLRNEKLKRELGE